MRCRGGACECYYDCSDRNCGPAITDAGSTCPSQTCGNCPSGFTCSSSGQCSALAPCNVNLVVVDKTNNRTVSGSCTLSIRGVSMTYTRDGFIWSSPSTSWDVGGGFGTYGFGTSCPGYNVNNETISVTTTTTTVTLTVIPAPIPVEVYKAGDLSQQLNVTCQVEVTGSNFYFASFSWTRNTGVVFDGVTSNGFGTYEFVTTCPGYTPSTQDISVTATTRVIQLQVSASSVTIEVREKYGSQKLITVTATIKISSGSFSQTYNWVPNSVNAWTPPKSGDYTFITDATGYTVNQDVRTITSSTSVVTLYIYRCGDGFCTDGESFDFCAQDCAALYLQFERYDGNTPVTGYTLNTYANNPRTFGGPYGPVSNDEPVLSSKTLPSSSNVISLASFNRNTTVYLRINVTGYINFYWVADLSTLGLNDVFTLRGHLSPLFTTTNLPYRVVNTWRTTDNEPPPYAPTDLNLHLFFSDGSPCDINNRNVTSGTGTTNQLICSSISDAKQSGGPASIDFSLSANSIVTTWNTKPPRNAAIAPSQANRYLVNSGSYVVHYGITADAGSGKQLGQVILTDALKVTPASNSFDIWRQADILVTQPRQSGLSVTPMNYLGTSTIDTNLNMIFDCQINPACSRFVVPYADTGR